MMMMVRCVDASTVVLKFAAAASLIDCRRGTAPADRGAKGEGASKHEDDVHNTASFSHHFYYLLF